MRSVVVFLLIARIAAAHQSSTKYLEVRVDGNRVTLELRFVPGDVTEPMKLDPNAKPTSQQVIDSPAVPAYVARWIALRECSAGPAKSHIEEDGFVVVSWVATCSPPAMTIDATPLFSLDRKIELFVHKGGDDSIRITAAQPTLAIDLPQSRWLTVLAHVVFCLLIAFVAARARQPMLAAAIGVACYSVAYLAGSLSGIELPYAEILVGITVVYAIAESLLRPDWKWRTATFTAFGIVHGLADSHQPSILIFNIVAALGACALTFVALLVIRAARAR